MMAHTPTPYQIHGSTLIFAPDSHQCVAVVSEPFPSTGKVCHESIEINSPNFEIACDNAEFIVKACNCHGALVAMLKQINETMEPYLFKPQREAISKLIAQCQ